VNSENFILINLNQNISRARKVAEKEQRNKWMIFGLLCLFFIGLTTWLLQINKNFNTLIQARENTIENIKTETANLKKEAKINLSKGDIISSYDLGKRHIPWSRKLIQLSEMTPYNMCITNLLYDTKSLSISAISKIEDNSQKEQQILNDFMNLIKSNEDFYKEFDEIKIKKTKKIDKDSQSYLSFEISARLKKKLKNRMDDISIEKKDQAIKETKKEKIEIKEKVNKKGKKDKAIKETKKEKIEIKEKVNKKGKKDKAKYSKKIIALAKSININDPDGTDAVKKFQDELSIYSNNDVMYGFFDSKTILLYGDVLDVQPETSWEKEYKNINKILAGVNDPIKEKNKSTQKRNTNTRTYDRLTIKIASAMASQIGSGVKIPDLDLIKRFQELTEIATENDSWYGVFNNETIEMLGKVVRAQ